MEKHIHKAKYDENRNLTDECAKCGKDIRNKIHISETKNQ